MKDFKELRNLWRRGMGEVNEGFGRLIFKGIGKLSKGFWELWQPSAEG